MLYAKVVVGLPVEGPFDYSVPAHLQKMIKEGVRVWVQFRDKKKPGYVVKTATDTNIKHVKPLLEVIDDAPVLDKNMLSLAKELSDYYGCSWGEAIETALPEALRKGKKITARPQERRNIKRNSRRGATLVLDLSGGSRWDTYLEQIKQTSSNGKSVIVLLPDVNSVLKAREAISAGLGITPSVLYRKQPKELEEWLKVRESESTVVIGTRSSIFAPVNNPGLIIIDEEHDAVYKQDQVPHYHARDVAFMRMNLEGLKLILGGSSLSLESFYLAKKSKAGYTLLPRTKTYPQIKIIDMRNEQRLFKQRNVILSKYLQDSIAQALDSKEKILLFLNRRGFATFATCRNCGTLLKCPRCSINLVYHFKENILSCRYCNYKTAPPQMCPNCNAAYIRYLGTGTEKIESEVSRIFPSAKVHNVDNLADVDADKADIFISTASIIKRRDLNFDLIGILSIDNSLNRIDFRSTEKAFALLAGLVTLTEKKVIIQTNLPAHYSLRAIEKQDINLFYEEELKQRKQLGFPPYRHLCLVKLRGKKEPNVKELSNTLFDELNKYSRGDKSVKIISVNPGQPPKLRGNFYWQILIKTVSPLKAVRFLKLHLKNLRHSGIIVTIDMDPV